MLMPNDDIETAIRDLELNRQPIDASELDARDYQLLLKAQQREAKQRTEQARRDSEALVQLGQGSYTRKYRPEPGIGLSDVLMVAVIFALAGLLAVMAFTTKGAN